MKAKFTPPFSIASNFPDLTQGNIYTVIGIEADEYRIMNDWGKPFLYEAALFEIVDSTEPTVWQTRYGIDGERYSYAPELSAPGFFEDVFDYNERALLTLQTYLQGKLPEIKG